MSIQSVLQMLYFTFGTKDVLEHECKNLDQRLELYMDNKPVELPSLEAVVVLNIATWGAGVRPWTLGAGELIFMLFLMLNCTFISSCDLLYNLLRNSMVVMLHGFKNIVKSFNSFSFFPFASRYSASLFWVSTISLTLEYSYFLYAFWQAVIEIVGYT